MRKFNQATNSNAVARGGKRGRLVFMGVSTMLALFFLGFFWYGLFTFLRTYCLRTPIIIQNPIVKREIKPLKKGRTTTRIHRPMVKQVEAAQNEASEVKEVPKEVVESFPKYLTDQGNINRTHILSYMEQQGYDQDNITAMDNIFKKESGYRADALNEIGAGGICQAYPASKMGCQLTTEDLMCQVNWCLSYVKGRYGSPLEAWNFHLANNWF